MRLLPTCISVRQGGVKPFLLLTVWTMAFIYFALSWLKPHRKHHATPLQFDDIHPLTDIVTACNIHDVLLVLIDPAMLNESQSTSNLAFHGRELTTFAVTDDQVEDLMRSLASVQGISQSNVVSQTNLSNPAWSLLVSALNCSVGVNQFIRSSAPCQFYSTKPAHLLLTKDSVRVHIVILFTRGSFFWSAPMSVLLSESLGDSPYANGTYALERFLLKEAKTSVGVIHVPSNARRFLFHRGHSEFIECNPTYLSYVTKEFPHMVPRNHSERDQKWLRDMLSVKHVFESHHKRVWIFAGTMLGWLRQCGFIAHTTDVDMAADPREFGEDFQAYLLKREEFKICNYHLTNFTKSANEFNFYSSSIKVDVFYLETEANYTWSGYFGTKEVFQAIYPPIDRLCSCELLGHRFTVPCNAAEIAAFQYGKTWLKPVFEGSLKNLRRTNLTYQFHCYK